MYKKNLGQLAKKTTGEEDDARTARKIHGTKSQVPTVSSTVNENYISY